MFFKRPSLAFRPLKDLVMCFTVSIACGVSLLALGSDRRLRNDAMRLRIDTLDTDMEEEEE